VVQKSSKFFPVIGPHNRFLLPATTSSLRLFYAISGLTPKSSQLQSNFIPTHLWRWNRQCSETLSTKPHTPENIPKEITWYYNVTKNCCWWYHSGSLVTVWFKHENFYNTQIIARCWQAVVNSNRPVLFTQNMQRTQQQIRLPFSCGRVWCKLQYNVLYFIHRP
jgi:hypothetical protein